MFLICILCVRVTINKRSFEPFCVWILFQSAKRCHPNLDLSLSIHVMLFIRIHSAISAVSKQQGALDSFTDNHLRHHSQSGLRIPKRWPRREPKNLESEHVSALHPDRATDCRYPAGSVTQGKPFKKNQDLPVLRQFDLERRLRKRHDPCGHQAHGGVTVTC